ADRGRFYEWRSAWSLFLLLPRQVSCASSRRDGSETRPTRACRAALQSRRDGSGDPSYSRIFPAGVISTWPVFCDTCEEAGTEARPTGTGAAPPLSVGQASLPAGPPPPPRGRARTDNRGQVLIEWPRSTAPHIPSCRRCGRPAWERGRASPSRCRAADRG